MVESLRVAVVGCGRMGRAHVEALATLPRSGVLGPVEVVACDPMPACREWAASKGVRAYVGLDEARAAGQLDAVVVAAPTALHPQLVEQSLEMGVAVLCEKPGAESPDALLDFAERAEGTGAILRFGYWHRFVPALRKARDAIAGGSIGDVLALSSAQWDGSPPSLAFLAGSGGELVDMGVHEIDFARWVLGCRLVARGAAWSRDAEGRNAAVGVLESESGTVVTVSTGRVLEGGEDGCWFEVLGTRRSLFDRWLWGSEGQEVNRCGVADQDRAFCELVTGHDDAGALSTASEAAEVLDLANGLTALALDQKAESGGLRAVARFPG